MDADAYSSPEQAIRAFLTTGNKRGPAHPPPNAAGWQARTGGNELIARPDAIHFGRMRQTQTRQLHTVTFESIAGERMRLYCCVRRTADGGWLFDGGAGGSADGDPHRSQAWVNLCGGGWPNSFYAAGRVVDDGGATTLVRLHTANGIVLEDSVDDDHIVLFLSDDAIQIPLEVELWDAAGRLVARHQAMTG
ncbi:MAG TPA: hypothetical protein VIG77_17445 [Ktedonobacterales bacterium]|jgi:hypothetical protein